MQTLEAAVRIHPAFTITILTEVKTSHHHLMHNGIKALMGLGCLRSKLQSPLFQLRTVGIKWLETHEQILLWMRNQSGSSELDSSMSACRKELSCLTKQSWTDQIITLQEKFCNKTTSLLLCKKTFLRPLFTKALKTNTLCYANYLFKKDRPVTSS